MRAGRQHRAPRAITMLGLTALIAVIAGMLQVVAAPMAYAAPIFSDDFTSGDFSNWTASTRLTIDNANGSPAAPSARAQVTSQSAFAYRTLGSTYTQACTSVSVNLLSGSGVDLFRLRTASNGGIIKAFVASNGTLRLRSDFVGTTVSSGVALGSGWHNVELCGSVGGTTTWDLYRDGTRIVNAWQANTGTAPVGRIQIGDNAAKTFTVNFDHVVLDQVVGDEGTDTSPPTVPGQPSGTSPSNGSIQISWAASTDASPPITYRIHRDGNATSIGSTTTTSYTDTGLASGSSHTYAVDAVDALNNTSQKSQASAPITVMAASWPGHGSLAPDTVRLDTVRIENGEVSDIETIGNRAFIAGTFTSIRNANGTSVNQPYLAAFNMDTGLLDTTFRPTIDGQVAAVEASPDGSALYIAGGFNTVNGVTKRKLARIDPTTGATVTGFTAQLDARATSLAVSVNWVYVGGFFALVNSTNRGRLAAVNPTTGAADTGFNLPVTEGIGNGGTLKVVQLQLTSDYSTLLVVHTGRNVAGQQRVGMALIDTAAKSLRPWNTDLYADYLPVTGGVVRMSNGDISPDDSYFVVTTGGGGDRPPVSDTAVAFPMDGGATPTSVDPLWVSRLFDSAYGVAITEVAVYLAGHFRYLEAPTANQPWPGLDTQNYGWGESLGAGVLGPDQVVRRDMLGALDPATGTALEWNPTAEAALGHGHIEAVPRGLLVGMDSSVIGGQAIGRFGFFDFQNIPPPSAADTWIDYPYEGALAAAGEFTFEGRAEATSQVASVQLEIQNRTSKQYLQDDGVTWSSTWNAINATLAATDQIETTWSYTSPNFPDGSFIVYARTFAEDGTRDSTKASKKFETSIVDNPAPDTTVTGPANPITTSTFVITGVSYDDEGVVNVAIQIRNTVNNFYLQDDGTFAGQTNTLQADLLTPNQPSTFWELEVTLPDGDYNLSAVATDNEGQVEHEGLGRRLTVSTGSNTPPAITLDTVTTGTVVVPNTQLVLAGTATDDVAVTQIEVSVRNNNTNQGVQIDGTWGLVPAFYQITPPNTSAQTLPYSYTTPPLPIGSYTIRVRATDNTDTRTPTTATPPSTIAQPNVSVIVGTAGDALPNTTLDFTGSRQDYDLLTLPITGTATDDHGVSSVNLVVYNSTTRKYLTNTLGATSFFYTLVNTPVASPDATSTTFSQTFTLPEAGNYRITAVAVDTAGQYDGSTTGATATYLIFPGDADPTLVPDLQTPVNGFTYTNFIPIGGRATDDNGISRVTVRVQNLTTGLYLRTDGTMGASQNLSAYLTNPGGAGSNFSYTTPTLAPDTYIVTVYPTDNVGQVMLVPFTATVTVVAG